MQGEVLGIFLCEGVSKQKDEKNQKNFKKTIDKMLELWYDI
jgi:hypothetical protein